MHPAMLVLQEQEANWGNAGLQNHHMHHMYVFPHCRKQTQRKT